MVLVIVKLHPISTRTYGALSRASGYDLQWLGQQFQEAVQKSGRLKMSDGHIYAQKQDPIDIKEAECLNKAVSTMDMKACVGEAYQAWDRELNTIYKGFMNEGSPALKTAVKESERAWLKSRDSEFNLIDLMLGDPVKNGSLGGLEAMDLKTGIVKSRVELLRQLGEAGSP
jgi:uncharacterized protein YecT (DUF1311 family)